MSIEAESPATAYELIETTPRIIAARDQREALARSRRPRVESLFNGYDGKNAVRVGGVLADPCST